MNVTALRNWFVTHFWANVWFTVPLFLVLGLSLAFGGRQNSVLLTADRANQAVLAQGIPAETETASNSNVNAAIALFRQRSWPLVFVQHSSASKPAGSYAWAIHEQFDCQPDDMRLCKRHYNAFWETGLDALLQAAGVELVVVSGYVAEFCVLSTARGAGARLSQRDFDRRHCRDERPLHPIHPGTIVAYDSGGTGQRMISVGKRIK